VIARHTDGTIATDYRGTIHFTSTDPQAVLPADYTFQASDGGVHIFVATLRTVGSQDLTATDTADGSITGTQSGIIVTPVGDDPLQADARASAFSGIASEVVATSLDAYGNGERPRWLKSR
jgi:hypothetical protein